MRKERIRVKKEGITLIALVVTIVVLIILATISLNLLMNGNIIGRAEQSKEIYANAQEKEEEGLNNVDYYIGETTNRKPNIELLKYSGRTTNTMKITAMATDGDGENLTYKLYVGTTKENLEEQTEIKENIEQGTEVNWNVAVTSQTIYYYKIIVSDKYVEVDSGIRETNNEPILGDVTIKKDLDETTGNWVKAEVSATDKENDKLTYTFKMWKKEEGKTEAELINQEPTKIKIEKDKVAGEKAEITINELEEYQDYIYRVDVTDNNNIVMGTTGTVRTYCSGKGLQCERWYYMHFLFREWNLY